MSIQSIPPRPGGEDDSGHNDPGHPLPVHIVERLDWLIAEYHLHGSPDPLEPVSTAWIQSHWWVSRRAFPAPLKALAMRWHYEGEEIAVIALNSRLDRPWLSAHKRHALAHEVGHLICRHQGSAPEMLYEAQATPLQERQEREAEYVAAYLLISTRALQAMEGMPTADAARLLDVPEPLVRCRFELWRMAQLPEQG